MKTEEKGIVQERREVVMEDQGRVLIVDDEEIFLMSTADLLRREGYAVDSVLDAREAAQKLSENRYDVLISDIRMPWNPDLKLIQEIPEPNTGLPVILVTGYPSAPTAIQAISLSVLAYFVKPLEFYELLATVRKGVALRKTKDLVAESSLRVQGWADEMLLRPHQDKEAAHEQQYAPCNEGQTIAGDICNHAADPRPQGHPQKNGDLHQPQSEPQFRDGQNRGDEGDGGGNGSSEGAAH